MRKTRPMPVVEMTLPDIDRAKRAEQRRMEHLLAAATIESDAAHDLRRKAGARTGLIRAWWMFWAGRRDHKARRLCREVITIRKAIRMGDDIGLHRVTRRAMFSQEKK